MPLSAGTVIGAYEVVSPLGVGGMGEVYRARDRRLKRDVAIKVLPEAVSADPDRLSRFQREAEILASLNHPNIAAIYGIEKANAGTAIVLEFVDGETLAETIGRGAMSHADALPIARAIADALEAAHDRGIVHRDLKPANVKITTEGKVKVLDFGLAKAVDGTGQLLLSGPDGAKEQGSPYGVTQSPTITTPAVTMAGVILGTAAYMSPEQARGKPVDRRTDIWAFGCVLYEMLTGRRTFDAGETVSDAIAAILKQDPDWTALPSDTPPHIRTLLKRSLQKDPQKRLPHIGIARLEIDAGPDELTSTENSAASPQRRGQQLIPIVAITTTFVAALAIPLTWWLTRAAPLPTPVTRFTFTLPEGQVFSAPFLPELAISPDGTHVVYVANARLYLRSLADFVTRPITGTEVDRSLNLGSPVFSPDGDSIAYWTNASSGAGADVGVLKKISLQGGAATTIAETGRPLGMSWDENGILVSAFGKGILRVAPNGGTPEQLIPANGNEWILGARLLPGGDAVLYTVATPADGLSAEEVWSKARIVLQSLKSSERKTLVENASDGRYLSTGHLVYSVGGVVMARAFDIRRQAVSDAAVPMIDGVSISGLGEWVTGSAQMSVSRTGSLIYVPGSASAVADQQHDLVVVDRDGAIQPLKLPPGRYQHPRVSPDGKQIAYYTEDRKSATVFTYELSGATAPRRLTFDGHNRFPIWTHDGKRLTYQSVRNGMAAIYWQPADGAGPAEALTEPEAAMNPIPNVWTQNGKILLFENGKVRPIGPGMDPNNIAHMLWSLSIADKKAVPFGDIRSITAIAPISASISRNGWLVYTVGSEPARVGLQVFAQQFPSGPRHLVASGAADAQWHPNGKEVFFLNLLGLGGLSASITTQPQLAVSNPLPLSTGLANVFRRSRTGLGSSRNVDIMPDGEHFVAAVARDFSEGAPGTPPQINVVLNWFEELKARVPAN